MAWSRSQIIAASKAATAAGWDDARRRLVLRHIGAGNDSKGQPSSGCKRLTNGAFEHFMAIAEIAAAERGALDMLRPPGGASPKGETWGDVAIKAAERQHRLIRQACDEATRVMPAVFTPGFINAFCVRQTMNDDKALCRFVPAKCIEELDHGQSHRVIEGLRAWIGTKFASIGQEMRSLRPVQYTGSGHRSVWARQPKKASGIGQRASGTRTPKPQTPTPTPGAA